MMQTLWQDGRYGIRMLLKNPGFTAVASITLALGIGANTAIFSVVNSILLCPFPYHDAEKLVYLWEKPPGADDTNLVSVPSFENWRAQTKVFEEMATLGHGVFFLTGGERPEDLWGLYASANFFRLLGVQPLLGRTFLDGEDAPGQERVVVLRYGFWQRRFGGDPGVIGKTVTLNGLSHTIIGVLRREFRFSSADVDLWAPYVIPRQWRENWDFSPLMVMARLKSETTIQQAQAEMDTIASRIAMEHSKERKGWEAKVISLREGEFGSVKPALLMLLSAVALVLLIACCNVANLLVARATARTKEIAVRLALGAGRLRLIRQLLTESVLLAVIGAAFGVLLAVWGVQALTKLKPWGLPENQPINIDRWVLGYTLLLALGTGIVFGLVPALQASRVKLNESLKEGGRGSSASGGRFRVRNWLVISEMTLAVLLLIGAGLLIQSFIQLNRIHLGYRPDHLLVFDVDLPSLKYSNLEHMKGFYQRALERFERLPGVESASVTSNLPTYGWNMGPGFYVEGHPINESERPRAVCTAISPGYFQTVGIPLLKGRYFTEQDRQGSPDVAIVNETLARRFFPNEDPIGKRLITIDHVNSKNNPAAERSLQIVGMVGNINRLELAGLGAPDIAPIEMNVPYLQRPTDHAWFAIRTKAEPLTLHNAVGAALDEIDKEATGSVQNPGRNASWLHRTVSVQHAPAWPLRSHGLGPGCRGDLWRDVILSHPTHA
jgi:putative ABC transport system permease protein